MLILYCSYDFIPIGPCPCAYCDVCLEQDLPIRKADSQVSFSNVQFIAHATERGKQLKAGARPEAGEPGGRNVHWVPCWLAYVAHLCWGLVETNIHWAGRILLILLALWSLWRLISFFQMSWSLLWLIWAISSWGFAGHTQVFASDIIVLSRSASIFVFFGLCSKCSLQYSPNNFSFLMSESFCLKD